MRQHLIKQRLITPGSDVMNKLNTKHKILILSAIFVVSIALFYFFVWTPQLAKLDELEKQAQAEQGKITAAKAKLAMLSEVKKECRPMRSFLH
jgi:Tfp pilus assembly protein PilO